MEDVSVVAILAGTVAMFAVGAVWYMPLFGSLWGKIHGFDKHSKKDQEAMQKEMMPMLGVQALFTALSAAVIAGLLSQMPTVSPYRIVSMIWLGFLVPATVSSVLFGGTEKKWFVTKTLVMIGELLARLVIGAWVISMIQN